jgi:molybdopterin molybdotransferase
VLSFDDARERVLANVQPLGAERVDLSSAADRVLAESLVAVSPLPPFDYSAMDGYAVRAANFSGAGPWALRVAGESRAGAEPPALEAGTTCRIFTGAGIPVGADAVVIQEDVELDDDGLAHFAAAPKPYENVRRRGEDLESDQVAVTAGTRLGAYHLAVAASLDRVSVLVARRPRVVIVSTGDELRAAGKAGPAWSIPESNGIAIATLARSVGATAELAPLAADDAGITRAAILAALGSSDLLVTIGGVSVGRHDLVRPALEAAGAQLDFWKVRIKPGKPLVLGSAGRTRILGLPGNPVSAQLTFGLFGLPLLRALQGQTDPLPVLHDATLLGEIEQRPGRLGFYRAKLTSEGLIPLGNQASGNVLSLAQGDALVLVPADSSGYARGDRVKFFRLAEL